MIQREGSNKAPADAPTNAMFARSGVELPVHRMNASEYAAIIDAGVLEGHRVELIHGCITDMSPANPPHDYAIRMLTRALAGDPRYDLLVQLTLFVADDQVYDPDFTLIDPKADHRAGITPGSVHLVIEVANTSLARDTEVKGPAYAQAGIEEYWVVDINARAIRKFTSPSHAGYEQMRLVHERETIAPERFPDRTIDVASLFFDPA